MSLRLSVANQGTAKTYIMNFSALLDEMSGEGSPIDSIAAKVVFLEHITHPEYRTVVVDLSEGKYTLQDCYKRIGRVGISIETTAARRTSSNQRNINGITTNRLLSNNSEKDDSNTPIASA